MRIHVLGAAGEVTGSCYLIETASARVLVDFGLHQGSVAAERRNYRLPPGLDRDGVSRLDAVLVTHAHIDHIGRLPLLTRTGPLRAPIWSTAPTVDLAPTMLRDSANLQEQDARRMTIKRRRQGKPAVEPLYLREHVEPLLPLLRPVNYRQSADVAPGIKATWFDAGHIIGSSSIELRVSDWGSEKVIVFSGDLGPKGTPLMNDPTPLSQADLVFLESTYGDRDHRPYAQTIDEFVEIIKQAVWAKEKVLIPAFALGRTQTLVYVLAELMRSGRVPTFPVYIDSPMAIEVQQLYRKHSALLDGDTNRLIRDGNSPVNAPNILFSHTGDDSKKLNTLEGAAVIIAGSGMCNGGRIVHHLRHNVWRRGVHVLIVGYQAAGTLGRRLVEGAEYIKIYGEPIIVRAKIHCLGGFSAHAGRSDLIEWGGRFAPVKPRMMLTHGEDKPRAALADALKSRFGLAPHLPAWGEVIEL